MKLGNISLYRAHWAKLFHISPVYRGPNLPTNKGGAVKILRNC